MRKTITTLRLVRGLSQTQLARKTRRDQWQQFLAEVPSGAQDETILPMPALPVRS